MKVKTLTTTIEDEVVFMTDPTVEFVSLVKYGANRTPFKVLKEEKEENGMKKVVQSILVSNNLTDEETAKALEGMSKKEAKEYSTYTSYPQLPLSRCEDDLSVVKHEDIEGVYVVLGTLKEGESEQGTLVVNSEKEAVDYATLDNLYTELYAMADVVGGAMRQENAGVDFRKSTILTAIDNFRSFAEVVLNNLLGEKADSFINPENYPTLVYPLVQEKKEEKEDKTDDKETTTPEEDKKEEPTETPAESTPFSMEDLVSNLSGAFNTALTNFGDKLIETLGKVEKQVKDQSDEMKKEIDDLKSATISSKTEKEEETDTPKEEKIFKGVLFRSN